MGARTSNTLPSDAPMNSEINMLAKRRRSATVADQWLISLTNNITVAVAAVVKIPST